MPFLQTLGGGSVSGFRVLDSSYTPDVEATGGTIYVWFDSDGYKHKTHMFTENGTWSCTKANGPIAFAMIGGGGGGAGGHDADWFGGGGGGAGGVVYSTNFTNYNASGHGISLGGGGSGGGGAPQGQGPGNAGKGNNGGNTDFFSLQAKGGGGGGRSGTANDANDGGCGGGPGSSGGDTDYGVSNQNTYGSNNVTGIGYRGGTGYSTGSYPYGAGGGGAGSNGGNIVQNNSTSAQQGGGSGGASIDLKGIFGGSISYLAAGGGGGGAGSPMRNGGGGHGGDSGYANDTYDTAIAGGEIGGTGRGGDAEWGVRDGGSGSDGLGGGGGGGCGGWQGGSPGNPDNTGNGGDGGSGIVAVSYKIDEAVVLGNTQSNPATSARAIKAAHSTAESGIYWIKPSGYSGSAFEVFCDMDTDGGGWMHVATYWDDHKTNVQGNDGWTGYNSTAQYKHMWGYFLHRSDSGNYTESSSHGGRFIDDEYNMLGSIGWPGNFGKNFKHPQLYASASLNQVMMKDRGLNLRRLWYTQTFTSVNDTRYFFGKGNNMWVDSGTQRNNASGGFRILDVTSDSQNDDVFGNCSKVYFGFGEPQGVESTNQDRSMITPYGLNSQSVSATQGIGVSRANSSGYQRCRNIDDEFRDEPVNLDNNAQYSYTLWIRDST